MSEKKIIQFDSASQVNSDAYVPITQLVNGNQKTLKALIDQLGAYISRVQQYNDLDTDAKDLIGAINEAAQSGSIEMEQTVTTPVSIASISDGGDNIPVKSLKVLVSAVQSGSGTPSPSNIRSISGWSSANVTACGKNILNYNAWKSSTPASTRCTYVFQNNGVSVTATSTDGYCIPDYEIPVRSGQQITLSWSSESNIQGQVYVFFSTTNFVYVQNSAQKLITTIPDDCSKIRIRFGVATTGNTINYANLQIEYNSTSTAYEAYKGTTHTIPFGQTVYGGLLDVTKGVLTITHKEQNLVELTWSYLGTTDENKRFLSNVVSGIKIPPNDNTAADLICEKYATLGYNQAFSTNLSIGVYSGGNIIIKDLSYNDATTFQNSLNNVKAVFALATPIVINLTPTQVKTLLTCNIFSDTGDIDTLIYFNNNADEVADVVEAYVGDVVNLYATLATGNTSVTISSSAIHTNSTIDIYTDNDVDYISAVVTEGQIVITFDAQASDLGVKVRVS